MLLEELKPNFLYEEAISVLESESQEVQTIKNLVSQIPKFPGTELKKHISELINTSAKLLKDFAKKAKPFAKSKGYRTQIFDQIIDNPEKIAKQLIRKYVTSYKDNAMIFNLRDILKDIDMNLD